jgi:uncharacterized protein
MDLELTRKYNHLKTILGRIPSLAVGFSGGVDSSLLLAAAVEALGDRVVALTADSPLHPDREIREAIAIGGRLRVRHILVRTDELHRPAFAANTPDRCYICKQIIFKRLQEEAARLGIVHLAHGVNMDDLDDYRPGLKAAGELAVMTPLVEAQLPKSQVRRLARNLGLPNWDRPAKACLASRIPYETVITPALLQRVAAAEDLLEDLGFRGARVRSHGSMARLELASVEDMARTSADDCRTRLLEGLKAAGFDHVAVDLEGYRQGSLNAGVLKNPTE